MNAFQSNIIRLWIGLASFPTAVNAPFRPLFPAPNHFTQVPSTGSPLLFQQSSTNMPNFNPLLQPPTAGSHFSSPLIQPIVRPPTMPSAFQAPPSAFTSLVPSTNPLQSVSSIQPKLTIGTNPSSTSFLPPSQPIQYPIPRIPSSQTMDHSVMPPPPLSQEKPIGQSDSHFQPLPLNTMKDLNAALPPPPPPPPQPSATRTLHV